MNNELYTVHRDAGIAEGTSYQGEIDTDFQTLVKHFGTPLGGDNKTQANWIIRFADDLVATIYDWKQYGIPLQITHWNIGGSDPRIVSRIHRIIRRAK